jgi:hypothetical protein
VTMPTSTAIEHEPEAPSLPRSLSDGMRQCVKRTPPRITAILASVYNRSLPRLLSDGTRPGVSLVRTSTQAIAAVTE